MAFGRALGRTALSAPICIGEVCCVSIYVGSALFAYVVTMVSALVVAKRSTNWRIRLLALTVGMLPLCQAVVLMAANQIWLSEQVGRTAQSLELLVCALCLDCHSSPQ